jgi:hypothetical protein
MEGYCSTGQRPQRAVVPVEEEEEVYINDRAALLIYRPHCLHHLGDVLWSVCLSVRTPLENFEIIKMKISLNNGTAFLNLSLRIPTCQACGRLN